MRTASQRRHARRQGEEEQPRGLVLSPLDSFGALLLKGAKFIEADILTVPEFPRARQIYHLACPASPPFYQKDPVRTWKISVIGTMRVAEWALKIGARVVFTSTSEVYGDPLEHPRELFLVSLFVEFP